MSDRYSNPFGGDFKAPDMDKVKKLARRFLPIIVVIIAGIILAVNSIYSLNSGEEAVITRIGSHVRSETEPGLKFKIPFVDAAHKVNVAGVRRMEFGFRQNADGVMVVVPEEALMLTGEGELEGAESQGGEARVNGLVNADWVIQYRISNSYNFLFKVENPEETLRSITQAAYRRVVASHPLDAILTDRKDDIQQEIMRDLQEIINEYEMGIRIIAVQLQDASPPDEVRDAFLDVTRSQEDRIARTNEAERYRMEELPRAEGRAVAIRNEAQGYRERRVNEALGTIARYEAILQEYLNEPSIMRTRLYMEMIREVMPQIDRIYFLDSGNGNLLEILHLGQ
jgi:membrane protease subunit HflK